MNLITISEEEFNLFNNSYNHPNFWQSVNMCKFKEEQGWTSCYLGLKNQDKIVATTSLVSCSVFGKYRLFKCLRGFLIDYDNLKLVEEFIKHLKDYLHQHHCLYFQIDPYVEYQKHDKNGMVVEGIKRDDLINLFKEYGFQHHGFTTSLDMNFEPRWMQVLDLNDLSSNQVLKNMSSNARRNIKNLMKSGVKTKFLESNEFSKIFKYVSNTGNKRGFNGPEEDYYIRFHNAFHDEMKVVYAYLDVNDYIKYIQNKDDEEKIIEAEQLKKNYGDEMPLGAAMFVVNKYEIVFVFGGSNETPIRFHEGYALQWSMIQYALEHGINRYNFYGISGNFDKTAEDYGVFLFKKGFGSTVIELVGNFEYIDRPFLYSIYQFLRKIKHSIKKGTLK